CIAYSQPLARILAQESVQRRGIGKLCFGSNWGVVTLFLSIRRERIKVKRNDVGSSSLRAIDPLDRAVQSLYGSISPRYEAGAAHFRLTFSCDQRVDALLHFRLLTD